MKRYLDEVFPSDFHIPALRGHRRLTTEWARVVLARRAAWLQHLSDEKAKVGSPRSNINDELAALVQLLEFEEASVDIPKPYTIEEAFKRALNEVSRSKT